MIDRFELLLLLGTAAFYLQDSAMLLHYDEVVLVERRRKWRFSMGMSLQMGGRWLFLPNPFAPTSGLFRGSWLSGEPRPPENWPGLEHFIASLSPLKTGCRFLFGLLMIVLPLLLWRYPHPLALLVLLVLVYMSVAALVFQLWRRRHVLELTPREVLSIGFESLACPPHAINLVRKLCLRRGLRGDVIAASRRTLSDADLAALQARLDDRISLAMAFADESGQRHSDLHDCRLRFQEQLK